jgi:5-methylcytosine-specific restriction endonuclease McrA
LLTKDEKRNFSYEQRLAIWRRDEGICQIKKKCEGQKLAWNDEWDADHIKPFIKGGKTIVANGRVSCSSCNRSR